MAIGFVGALESAILDPEVVLRFVRRNVDVLGYPDFLIGMVRVGNRVVLFSHHDRIGNRLLNLVRAKIEEDVKREEAEIEREGEGEGDVGVSGSAPAHVYVHASAPSRILRAAPAPTKYKVLVSNRSPAPTPKPAAVSAVDRPVNNNGGDSAKAAATATAPDSKRLASERLVAGADSLSAQSTSSTPRVSANDSSKSVPSPAGQGANRGLAGDFVLALITNLYHKHRDKLLELVGSVVGG
jgi:hypothetical protein